MKAILLTITLTIVSYAQAQQTYVPDDNFEAYLEANAMGNGISNDDYVTTANISGVTTLFPNSQGISDLTGIEDFVSLEMLQLQNNFLTSIDVTQNTSLWYLYLYGNNISTIDLSQNTLLSDLSVYGNNISTIDLSQNTLLTELDCGNNSLSTLDITQNTSLEQLNCSYNQLTALDISIFPNMWSLNCSNNLLTCLYANNGNTFEDPSLPGGGFYDFNCSNNNLVCVSVLYPGIAALNYNYDPGVGFNGACFSLIDNDVNQFGSQLSSEQNGASYQWLDCDNNYAVISGETNQVFVANQSGNYAVEITYSGCFANPLIDTSTCVAVDCQSDVDNDINQIGPQLSAVQNGVAYQWLDCINNYSQIAGEINQTYLPTTTGYYAVELTFTDACGSTQVDTSVCHLVNYAGIEELTNGTVELLKITDLMGRETKSVANTPLIYYYSDGTIERVFKLEE